MTNDQPNTTMDINDCLCLNNISMTGCVYQLYIITSIPLVAASHWSTCDCSTSQSAIKLFVTKQNIVNSNHLVDKLQIEYSFVKTQIKLITIVQPEQQTFQHSTDFDPYQHIMECMTWTPIITKHQDKHNLCGK